LEEDSMPQKDLHSITGRDAKKEEKTGKDGKRK